MNPLKIMFEEHLPYVMPVVFATAMANMLWAIGVEVTLAVLGFTNIATVGTIIYWARRCTVPAYQLKRFGNSRRCPSPRSAKQSD